MLRVDENGLVDSQGEFDGTQATDLVGDWWTPQIKVADERKHMKLSLAQRIKRRIWLLKGSYTHPDGTNELDIDEKVGIDPTVFSIFRFEMKW